MHSTALYDDQGRFLGHSTEVEHHTAGDRAWCLEGMNEWCYPSLPCDSCQRARMGDPWEIIQRVREVYYGPVGLLDTRIQQIGDILRALEGVDNA